MVRSRLNGNVAAVVGTLRRVGLEALVASRPRRQRRLCVATIAARSLDPGSKPATARGLDPEARQSTLREVLELQCAD